MSANDDFLDIFESVNSDAYGRDSPRPSIGGITFELYGPRTQPIVSVDREERYVDKKPIGEEPVKQHLGPGFKTITIVGECTSREASRVDDIEGGEGLNVITARWSGTGTIISTSTESLGKYYRGNLVYKYTVELTEV